MICRTALNFYGKNTSPHHELQIGMYVAKLDLSWFRSPFLRH
ncbi:MAG: DUF3391 domain-containing protein, partial [Nitrospirae bacterium]|nr:DUF3391 domain-containing protein [Nitrospirota bacterium]